MRERPAQEVEARIAAQEAIAPKWVHLRNHVAGICPDIIAAVERLAPRLHFTGYRQTRSLPGIEAGLEGGNVDVACAMPSSPRTGWQSPSRSARPCTWCATAWRHATAILPRSIRSTIWCGWRAGLGQRGAVFTDELRAAGVRIDDATDDNGVNLRKMLAGHGRFVDMNESTLRRYLRSGDLAQRVRILPAVLKEEPSYFWVSRKADPAIARLLGRALAALKADGELDRIYASNAATP